MEGSTITCKALSHHKIILWYGPSLMIGKEWTQSNLRLRMSWPPSPLSIFLLMLRSLQVKIRCIYRHWKVLLLKPECQFPTNLQNRNRASSRSSCLRTIKNILQLRSKRQPSRPQMSCFRTMSALYAWVLSKMEFKCAVFPVLMLSMLSAWTNGYSGAGHAAQYARLTFLLT